MTDSAEARYEVRNGTLHIEDRDGDETVLRRCSAGGFILLSPDGLLVEDAKEFIERVTEFVNLEVIVGKRRPVPAQPVPEAGESDEFFPVVPNLSAIEVTEGLVARGKLPYGVLPYYDDRSGHPLGVQIHRNNGDGREEAFLGDYLVGGGGEPIRAVDRHLFDTFYRRVGA